MATQLCVALDVQLVVLSCCVRHRKVATRSMSVWERVASFCLLPQYVVSSVPWSGWVCLKTPLLLPVVVLWQAHPKSKEVWPQWPHTWLPPSSSMCGVRVVTPQGSADEMCCTGKEVVVDAYQSIKVSLWGICEVSVRVALEYFCPSNWNGGYCPPPKIKWIPMSGGGDRGDDEVGIRKYWVEVVFRYLMPHCVRCMPPSRFTLVVAVVAVIL